MRKLAVAALAAVILASAGFGVFRLEEELSEAGPGGDVLDIPVCENDPKTGLPLPGSHPMCPPIAPCAGCTIAPVPWPTVDTGLLKADPSAELTSPPIHRVGDAAALDRGDCPVSWQAAISDTTGMSVCFPPSIAAVTAHQIGSTNPQTSEVRLEDRFEITLSGKDLPGVGTINIVRSAGLTGPYDLDCERPEVAEFRGSTAWLCAWPQGRQENNEGTVPLYIYALLIPKSGSQWVFDGVIWGSAGGEPKNTSSLQATILDILSTLRLP